MANNLGQPTIQEISNVMCDQCNAVICLGCPVYELDKHARAQQNAHLTGLTWRCDACYRVNDESNKVCWFCETAPQVA